MNRKVGVTQTLLQRERDSESIRNHKVGDESDKKQRIMWVIGQRKAKSEVSSKCKLGFLFKHRLAVPTTGQALSSTKS